MLEVRRPVFVCGENPGLTLYAPATERVVAVASYWNCVASPWGVGQALVLWLSPAAHTTRPVGEGRILTNNKPLAHGLVNTLVQYFPEFREAPCTQLAYAEADCQHHFDGDRYQMVVQAPKMRVELSWQKILERKLVLWPRFPAGDTAYDLTTTICPCGEGQLWINGEALIGNIQTGQTAEGVPLSSAFLAFAETWVGPVARETGEG